MTTNSRPCSPLAVLPTELYYELLHLLDDYTATQLLLVCRSLFFPVAHDSAYWQRRYRLSYPMRPEEEELDRWMKERTKDVKYNRQSLLDIRLSMSDDLSQHHHHQQQQYEHLSTYSSTYSLETEQLLSPFYWYLHLKRRVMLQERWRRGHYQVHHIPLPSPSLASSTDKEQVVSVVATSPWRTLVIYRPIPLVTTTVTINSSVSPIRLVSVEHTRGHYDHHKGTSQSLSIPVEPSVYSLQDYAAVNSAKSPYALMSRNYTVVYNLYQYDYAYTWVWHRGHEHPLAIPSLRNRCCRPQTLIDHWLLVLVKFDSCSPDDSVPIYLIDLSQYTETETEKDTNEAESVIPINIKGGCVTCHVQSTDELSWRIFTGMHRSDRFHWQLWEVFLPNRSAEDTSTRQERTVLVASGCIPEPEPLSAFSNAVTYMDTCHSVIVDWRPEFSTTCQYSRYDLTGETPLTNLWLTDRQYSLDWHHCRAPARRTLSSTLFIDQQAGQVRMDTDKLVSDMNRQLARNRNAYLCRVAGALRIAGSVSRGWYLVEEPNQHCRNSDVLETKEQGDRYRILWQLPLTLTNRLHHHACATHVCSVENSHSGIVRSNSDGMHVKSNDQPILTLLDIAGACCQSSLDNSFPSPSINKKSMFPHSSNEYKNLWSRIRQFISKYS